MTGLLALPGVERYQVFLSQDGHDPAVKTYAHELANERSFIKVLNNDMRREHSRGGDLQVQAMLYVAGCEEEDTCVI
jgi:hypothetical protein